MPVRRGDEALRQLLLPPIEILKIDVEGFEPQVLKGLRERIRSDRPVILFELSERSKFGFADLGGLQAALYGNHRLFGVGTRSVSGPYRLDPFRFAHTTEALAVPAELLEPLAAGIPRLRRARQAGRYPLAADAQRLRSRPPRAALMAALAPVAAPKPS